MKIPTPALATLETVMNRYLELDPEVMRNVASLEGKVIEAQLRGIDISLFLLPGTEGIQVLGQYEDDADTRLSGTPIGLLKMALGSNVQHALFSGDVEISGDTHLGEQFKQILDDMEIDWEEHLSHITGDVVAHQVGNAARNASKWGKDTVNTLEMDTSEYLQEEARLVPTQPEVEEFIKEVDTVRNDTERMEARVRRLQEIIAQKE